MSIAARSLNPLDDYRNRAEKRMSSAAWGYLHGGAVDEISVERNSDRYAEIQLLPRVGLDVSELNLRQTMFGVEFPYPILLAPAALQKLFASEGELGTIRGAKAASTPAVVSMESSISTLELSKEAGIFFQHMYIQKDRELTVQLVRMAEDAGASGIVLTLDNPVPGIRYRQDSGMIGLPDGVRRANFELGGVSQLTGNYLDASTSWSDVEWLAAETELPVIVKGILHPDDARQAIDAGAEGLIASNHGGRNLDTIAHPIDCVMALADAVGKRVPLLLDGGIRRGTDVLKALALGADAVLIGRPYIWGLAVDGEHGVTRVIETVQNEFSAAMALCGLPSLAGITPASIFEARDS